MCVATFRPSRVIKMAQVATAHWAETRGREERNKSVNEADENSIDSEGLTTFALQ